LLKSFWDPEYVPANDDDNFDFEDELEEHRQEYDPPDLTDVLPSPENVDVADVSTLVSKTEESMCALCFDPHDIMRKIDACVHEYGEECLA
jgi:hypothetical protein